MSSLTVIKKKILCVVGTRPEAIKMAPVILKLRKDNHFDCIVMSTGQHREMTRSTLSLFDIKIDIDLDLMTPNQRLSTLAGKILNEFDKHLIDFKPHLVIAQGDTTTVMAISVACFHAQVPFAHVEAGLRTHNIQNPFPEEFNRKVAALTASLHFAPTKRSKENLVGEGIEAEKIHIAGNTVIDALHWVVDKTEKSNSEFDMILVTTHRRENFGQPLRDICTAIKLLHEKYKDIRFVLPVHPNPNVREVIREHLEGLDRVKLIEPVPYDELASLIQQSILVLTDSGGIQEEAPALSKPVLVLRTETERPEAVEAGVAKLIGTDKDNIVKEVSQLLEDKTYYAKMSSGASPYGDGLASDRIVAQCANFLGLPADQIDEFEYFVSGPKN
jgi:UDP-N-acetylglucosamine 2-epimerase (non-hydrolysing)